MASYIILMTLTDQGVRSVRDTTQLLKNARKNLEDKGGLQISDNNYFTATINGKRYRWRFTPPLTVDDGAEY
jgi:uncharacterized protein with GYD domain